MAFMEPQIEQGQWYEVETDNGIDFIPFDVIGDVGLQEGETANDWSQDDRQDAIVAAVRDYCEAAPHEVKLITGFGARLSAPGYLDCTPWCVFATEQEARDYLRDELGADEESDDYNDSDGPDEDALTTSDDIHFYQYGKLVLTVGDDEERDDAIRRFMDEQQFWPDAWSISDHGNAHRIDL
jgi:hypothetical protein